MGATTITMVMITIMVTIITMVTTITMEDTTVKEASLRKERKVAMYMSHNIIHIPIPMEVTMCTARDQKRRKERKEAITMMIIIMAMIITMEMITIMAMTITMVMITIMAMTTIMVTIITTVTTTTMEDITVKEASLRKERKVAMYMSHNIIHTLTLTADTTHTHIVRREVKPRRADTTMMTITMGMITIMAMTITMV